MTLPLRPLRDASRMTERDVLTALLQPSGAHVMSFDLHIEGGLVVDPANAPEPKVGDLWIRAGRIVSAPTDPAAEAAHTIDARGFVVMPGGVDVHCHIAGSKVNAAHAIRPEEQRSAPVAGARRAWRRESGTLGVAPTTFATGYLYAGLGYTTAVDAAIAPLGARHAHP